MKTIVRSFKILGIFILLLGLAYPLFITGIAQATFRHKADGSLIERDGKVVGSVFIGQKFDSAIYFSGRPSATGYGTLPSGASNLSLTSRKLYDEVQERNADFAQRNALSPGDAIPSEMLFASASGLDPHISPMSAFLQLDRVAVARHFSEVQKRELSAVIENMTEKPQFGLLGETRVNVLLLNLRLDEIARKDGR